MTTNAIDITERNILDELKGTRDALSVRRVFGDPTTIDGVTIIPVARVSGGGGGGGGTEGPSNDDGKHKGGRGFGTGFGLGAVPVGVYEIRDGDLRWQPAVDVNLITKGAQVLAGIIAVCVSLVLLRRST